MIYLFTSRSYKFGNSSAVSYQYFRAIYENLIMGESILKSSSDGFEVDSVF